jgi:hypothetical protein
MQDWKSRIKADPTDWLLEEENPSVRYFALRDILDRYEDDPDVQNAKREIMRYGAVPRILQLQTEPEYLQTWKNFYTAKYSGLVWQLIVLAELGAIATPQIIEQCEYLLDNAQERENGGFSQHGTKASGGRASEVIPCLTGNLVWSLIHFGYLGDARLQKALEWITRFMRFDDGEGDAPQGPPYDRYEMCWGRHTCHMGVVKTLKALSAIPKGQRTIEIECTIKQAAEFMLLHRIYRRSHNLKRNSKPGWNRFGFPMMYQTDVLEILDILAALRVKDDRMFDAVELVLSKQDGAGRWEMQNSYNDRLLVPIEEINAPSKWITLRALRVLKNI